MRTYSMIHPATGNRYAIVAPDTATVYTLLSDEIGDACTDYRIDRIY